MSDWTEAEDGRLKKALAAGMSASQAAAEVGNGKSRNAIIGRASRLGLQMAPRNVPSRSKASPRKRHAVNDRAGFFRSAFRNMPAHPRPQPDAPADAPETGPVAMIEVLGRYGRCKLYLPGHEFLTGLVCGVATDPDKPYCAHHMKTTRTPVRVKAG